MDEPRGQTADAACETKWEEVGRSGETAERQDRQPMHATMEKTDREAEENRGR